MSNITKHLGKHGETGCVVIFRELPGDEDHCLIVEPNSLADNHHDDLMNVIMSSEGQSAQEISDVLSRRQFSDGTNMLQGLHFSKKLKRVPVDFVKLVPHPGSSGIPLSAVNQEIRKLKAGNPPSKVDAPIPETRITTKDIDVDYPSLQEENQQTEEQVAAQTAANLRYEAAALKRDAEMLIKEAEAKLVQAESLFPLNTNEVDKKTTRRKSKSSAN